MWSIIAALGGIGSILAFGTWLLKSYVAKTNADATAQERQDGANEVQNEALNQDIKRTQEAADAGGAVSDSLPDIIADPNNRAGK